EVSIIEKNSSRLAAELQADAGKALGADGSNVLARCGRAGKGNLIDALVADEIVAALAAGRNKVEHASGQPSFLDRLGQDIGFERRFRRRLCDERAASGEASGNLV